MKSPTLDLDDARGVATHLRLLASAAFAVLEENGDLARDDARLRHLRLCWHTFKSVHGALVLVRVEDELRRVAGEFFDARCGGAR